MRASLPEGVMIKEGGYYKRRDGLTVAALECDSKDVCLPWYCGPLENYGEDRNHRDCWWYSATGNYDEAISPLDLVAETDSPFVIETSAVGERIQRADAVAFLPTDSTERKNTPIFSGVMNYFPRALAYIAQVSKAGNDKHNPGQPLHWSKDKSNDHADCVARHLIEHGTIDPDDNLRHTGKLAWRSLALLETELEKSAQSVVVSS